jgi:hypothetical protein
MAEFAYGMVPKVHLLPHIWACVNKFQSMQTNTNWARKQK